MTDEAAGSGISMLSVFTLYEDPGAASQWLCEAFGFEVTNQFEADGRLIHAELRSGPAVVIVEQAAAGQRACDLVDGATVRAPYLALGSEAEIDALHERAIRLGATSINAPGATRWGNYRCELLDPEGHQWSFGTYVPGQRW